MSAAAFGFSVLNSSCTVRARPVVFLSCLLKSMDQLDFERKIALKLWKVTERTGPQCTAFEMEWVTNGYFITLFIG